MRIETIKIDIKPDEKQKSLIEREIKCSRYIYNFFVKTRYELWKNQKKNISFDEEKEILKKLKIKKGWLKCVESASLKQAIRDLDSDYYRFFKLNGQYPKYRKRDDIEQWYKTKNTGNTVRLFPDQNIMTLPIVGAVKVETKQKISGKISYVKISKTKDKYEATLTVQRS